MKVAAVFLFYACFVGVSSKITRTTVDGQDCMIPFEIDGKTYYDCPLADRYAYAAGYRWCPTDKATKKFSICAAAEVSTEKNHKCVFPFMYGNKIYDRCTTDGDTKPWCIYDKNGNWDYCDYCVTKPCKNGGTCTQIPDRQDYKCNCTNGFKGDNCDLKCPSGFTELTPGWCVKILTKLGTSPKAKSYCKQEVTGGRLAEPRTSEKFTALVNHMKRIYGSGATNVIVFIGAERPSSSRSLKDIRWLSDNTLMSMNRSMWYGSEPAYVGENCVRLGPWLKLYDTSCFLSRYVACEAPVPK